MSTSATPSPEDILKTIEHHHEQYIANIRLLHELSIRNLGTTIRRPSISSPTASGITTGRAPSPVVRAITFQPDPVLGHPPGSKRPRRLTDESQDQRRFSGQTKPRAPSTNDEHSDSDDEGAEGFRPPQPSRTFSVAEPPMTYVKKTLATEIFSQGQLADHLISLDETKKSTVKALDDIWDKRAEINQDNVLNSFEPDEDSPYSHAIYEVYQVGKNGLAKRMNQRHGEEDGEHLDTVTVWDTISKVNEEGDAVGRMTILQEPSPLMLGAAHMTMEKHFDMDELFQHLVSTEGNKGKTRAYMNRAFEEAPLRQRSFFFVFKYYTILGENLIPAPWQAYDSRPHDRRSDDHIDIVESSSVLALSLGGEPTRTTKQRVRKGGKVVHQKGHIYDPFAPWHLLNIQSFPDQIHSLRDEHLTDPFYNGPYAFLDCLGMEYRDAVKRYIQLNEMITKLITPPNQFMFDSRLRDKLLFEDAHFTYSRRYFWAYNTLGVINDGIKSMCKSYTDTFTKEFWSGQHRTLWPHPDPQSVEAYEYAHRMSTLRQELEGAVTDLEAVWKKNERTRTEICSLREQLFSGSSVKESRRAIEQGDNIKVLTGLSMIFLPLTFVTGVFSITTVDIKTNDWRFWVTMVAVCVPFFFLILILQTRVGMDALRKLGSAIYGEVRPLIRGPAPTNRAGGSTAEGAGAGASDARGRNKKKRFGKMATGRQRPVVRRTQSSLMPPGHHLQHRGTGTASLGGGGDKTAWVSWEGLRKKLRWDGGRGRTIIGASMTGPGEWEWGWWRKKESSAGKGGSGEMLDSNV